MSRLFSADLRYQSYLSHFFFDLFDLGGLFLLLVDPNRPVAYHHYYPSSFIGRVLANLTILFILLYATRATAAFRKPPFV